MSAASHRAVVAAAGRQFVLEHPHAWGTRGLVEQPLIEWARQFLKPGYLFLDVGAHAGAWSMLLASETTPTYAYEPQRSTFYRLCGAVALNRLEACVMPVQAAVAECTGFAELYVVEDAESERSSLAPRADAPIVRRERVATMALDDGILADGAHPSQEFPLPVGFIKIDVEGAERRVLEGARNLIATDQPVIVVACRDTPAREDFFAFVRRELHYQIVAIAGYSEMWVLCPDASSSSREENHDAEESMTPLQTLVRSVPRATTLWNGQLDPFGVGLVPPRSDVPCLHSIPSVATDGDDGALWCSIRWINYTNDEHWVCFDSDGIVRSVGELVRLHPQTLDILERRILSLSIEAEVQHPRYPSWTRGFEDLRLVRLPDGWAATATATDWNPWSQSEMFLLRIALPADRSDAIVERVVRLMPPAGHQGRTQKNWVPVHDAAASALFYVYRSGMMIYENGEPAAPFIDAAVPSFLSDLRGSSQALSLPRAHGGGWLYVAHHDHPPANGDHGRAHTVTHRLVWLDDDRRMRKVSPRFCFFAPGVEYCAGIARVGDELLFSLAVREKHLWMYRTRMSEVVASLVLCDDLPDGEFGTQA